MPELSSLNDLPENLKTKLSSLSVLINLKLSKAGITATDPDTASSLTEMLQVNKSLTHLDLSQNSPLSDLGFQHIFDGLQRNTTLVSLNLSHTIVTAAEPESYISLKILIQVNKSLTHLDLSSNDIFSNVGAHQIFEGLQHNIKLISLNLSSANITATDLDTARPLLKMLRVNKSLKHLHLSQNKLTNLGVYNLFEALRYNATLSRLSLTGADTATDPDTVKFLIKMIRINRSLKSLCISKIPTNQIISGIFLGLKLNSTLLHLHMIDHSTI